MKHRRPMLSLGSQLMPRTDHRRITSRGHLETWRVVLMGGSAAVGMVSPGWTGWILNPAQSPSKGSRAHRGIEPAEWSLAGSRIADRGRAH